MSLKPSGDPLAISLANDGLVLDSGNLAHGQIALANDARFAEANFNQPLTTYAVAGWGSADLTPELEFFAPVCLVPRRFTYAEWLNAEALLSDGANDDLRAIGADFKRVEYKSTKTEAKTDNRGLTIRVDTDEVADKPNWQQRYTMMLLNRLKRNSLRRAVTLLAAAGANTARTWDTTAGKDPDQDVNTSLIAAATASGLRPTRVGYGDTAWSKRILAHRAQNSAGGFSSAGMTEQQLAAWLGVEQVFRSTARFQSAVAAKSEIVSNLVLSFMAVSGATAEDPSNIKRFVSPTESGGPVRVFLQQVNAKCWDLTVEHYELIKITSTLGIRKETIS
jgi:hypothetical protein